jgi:acetyltransferase-like isoleucine patch superfamily enzyme
MDRLRSTLSGVARRAKLLLRLRPFWAAFRVDIARDADIQGTVWVPGRGRVHIGRGARLRAGRAPIELYAHRDGEIWIEDGAVLEAGSSIESTLSVRIGARARVGAFSKIIDNNFHRTSGDRGERPAAVPITIGADATVGPRAILLPGAAVGTRARVGAGRVVSFRLPAERLA